ncbi:MAG TPA: hypothetical protein PLF50_05880 [Candidatus Cloacimonadota bacterium]|nr:hypothetical protein [Candidatus Cloacimonadota bacterium]HOV17003.1 hypothetical protein [Candidatus Cloacimonadota bacterium]HQL14385.1 hypothetical protein [Candidatus Cloacimonadota bacterium]
MNDLQVSITEEEAHAMIDKVARFVAERGMASAGILIAESLRPLAGIGSQFMFFILPFAEILFDSKKYQQFALLLENEEYVRELISRMDELDEEINHEKRQQARLLRQRRRKRFQAFFRKLFKRGKKSENEKDN